jgi:hypothetical protein
MGYPTISQGSCLGAWAHNSCKGRTGQQMGQKSKALLLLGASGSCL